MLGPQPSQEDVEAVMAYLETVTPPPNPHRPMDDSAKASIERGRNVFESDWAACSSCHSGPRFTDGQVHDVGLGKPNDRYRGFNTPSLLGVWQKVTLLHDAQCSSLEEVLSGPHDPAKVSSTRSPTSDELRDLAAYLRSL
jgi:cytochrome c peroxidase